MAKLASSPAADAASVVDRSIDDLDAEICALASRLNARTYRMLMLVREFDDRMGWAKWGHRTCAEWLEWRCGMSMSEAREKVRTAQALRALPAISMAFGDGRLSYTKVRALTRVAHVHDEDSLLDYALRVTAPQVEERCRQIRNATPESVSAWRAWERRSLTLLRDGARGIMRISVELPIEQGELIAKALERAAETGDSALGVEFMTTGHAARRRTQATHDHDDAPPRTVGARPALHVSGLPQPLLRRWPPHRALGAWRRAEPC